MASLLDVLKFSHCFYFKTVVYLLEKNCYRSAFFKMTLFIRVISIKPSIWMCKENPKTTKKLINFGSLSI